MLPEVGAVVRPVELEVDMEAPRPKEESSSAWVGLVVGDMCCDH